MPKTGFHRFRFPGPRPTTESDLPDLDGSLLSLTQTLAYFQQHPR